MSSVCDENGQWWYHCGGCTGSEFNWWEYSERGKWVRVEDLSLEEPSEEFPFGRNLCSDCAAQSVEQGKDVDLIPEVYTIDISKIERSQ